MMSNHGEGWWIFVFFWMALVWFGVIAGSVWLVRSLRGSLSSTEAIDILDRRLANGKIEVEEHRRLRAELTGLVLNRHDAPVGWIVAAVAALGLIAILSTGALLGNWDRWDHMGRMHGGGRDTSGSSAVQGGVATTITIEDFSFQPGNMELVVGSTVTWINKDSAQHDARNRNGAWQTERLSDGESDKLTFDIPGEYAYYCSIHPSMKAKLVVR